MLLLALILATFWGFLWAQFLQRHTFGQYLASQRTWLTVVVGVGVDLLLLLLVLPLSTWWLVAALVGSSSLGIIARSINNEYRDHRTLIRDIQDTDR